MKLVGPEGSKDSKIAIIGEAPGAVEEREGRPFSPNAPAGSLLKNLMHQVGLTRADVYLTNVVKEHPPNDNIAPFFKKDSRGSVVISQKCKDYINQLDDELSEVKANVLVPVGNLALYSLCGVADITKYRGSILKCTLKKNNGRKVIPTIHPAAALPYRNPIYAHFIKADLKKVVRESSRSEIVLPSYNILIMPDCISAMSALSFIKDNVRVVGMDIEVLNGELSHICFSYEMDGEISSVSIAFVKNGYHFFNDAQEALLMTKIASILEDQAITKIGHNITFDAGFLYRRYGIRTTNMEDTMIQTGIFTPDFPKALDFVTSLYTDEPYYKMERKKWSKMIADDTSFSLYNAKDGAVLLPIFSKLKSALTLQHNLETYQYQKALIPIMIYIQERGMRVDVEGLRNAAEKSSKLIDKLTEELKKLVGQDINPRSHKQLAKLFYVDMGLPVYTKDGKPTTDVTALKRLARKGVKEAELLLEIRKLDKLKSTYFEMRISADGRLRSAMNPIGTTTGRLSSSTDIFDEGGNIQNLPPSFEQFILADEGYVLYSVDLDQAEDRIVSYIAPEPLKKQAYETGKDTHRLTASLIFGIPYEKVSDEPGSSSLGNGLYSQRFWGKKCNYSFNYGIGYKKFALQCELQEKEAKFLQQRYYQIYPGIKQYHSWVIQHAQKNNRIIRNLYGRGRLFLGMWDDDLFREMYSFIPQSTVADKINRDGLLFIWNNLREVDILNQVHDEIVFQLPLELGWKRHAEILLAIVKSLEKPLRWYNSCFVIPVGLKMGLQLGSNMSKIKYRRDDETVEGLANILSGVYGELRAKGIVQTLDWDFSDSSSFTEEM